MNFWFLIIVLGLAFVLQFIFTMLQMKSFSINYGALRKLGRVAIGKAKGGFKSGVIVMFAIDDKGDILKGSYISGVTVLARFKDLKGFENINIEDLRDEHVIKFPKQVQKAILNASSNYTTIINGGEVEQPKSPIDSLGGSVKKIVSTK